MEFDEAKVSQETAFRAAHVARIAQLRISRQVEFTLEHYEKRMDLRSDQYFQELQNARYRPQRDLLMRAVRHRLSDAQLDALETAFAYQTDLDWVRQFQLRGRKK